MLDPVTMGCLIQCWITRSNNLFVLRPETRKCREEVRRRQRQKEEHMREKMNRGDEILIEEERNIVLLLQSNEQIS